MVNICLDDANLFRNLFFFFLVSYQETFLAYNNISLNMKKDVV